MCNNSFAYATHTHTNTQTRVTELPVCAAEVFSTFVFAAAANKPRRTLFHRLDSRSFCLLLGSIPVTTQSRYYMIHL